MQMYFLVRIKWYFCLCMVFYGLTQLCTIFVLDLMKNLKFKTSIFGLFWSKMKKTRDSPVLLIWSLGQFTYLKIFLSVCTLSQLPSPTKALFTYDTLIRGERGIFWANKIFRLTVPLRNLPVYPIVRCRGRRTTQVEIIVVVRSEPQKLCSYIW